MTNDKFPVRAACIVWCLVAAALAFAAQAQSYPAKPIRPIVPFAPGGPNDLLGRLVGQKLTEQRGHPVVVENRGGAGGTVGLDRTVRRHHQSRHCQVRPDYQGGRDQSRPLTP